MERPELLACRDVSLGYEGQSVLTHLDLSIREGDYLCVQIAFRGSRIPCHPEINIPSFVKDGSRFVPSEYVPVPNMIGARRNVKARVGFLGDSITQGLGTDLDSYDHWCH